MKRKIVQVAVAVTPRDIDDMYRTKLFALADDGTLWEHSDWGWRESPPLPDADD